MLDTSVLIAAERRRFNLPALLAAHPGEPLGLAAITFSELRHGCLRAVDPRIRQRREQFIADIVSRSAVIPFGVAEAEHHATIWVKLETTGQIIGPHDLLIAATARSLDYSLATLNYAEFARVPELNLVQVEQFQLTD